MKRKISWYLRPTIFFKYFFQGHCQNKSNTFTLSGTSNFCNFKTSQNGSRRQSIASCFFLAEHDIQIFSCTMFPHQKGHSSLGTKRLHPSDSPKGFLQAFGFSGHWRWLFFISWPATDLNSQVPCWQSVRSRRVGLLSAAWGVVSGFSHGGTTHLLPGHGCFQEFRWSKGLPHLGFGRTAVNVTQRRRCHGGTWQKKLTIW